MDKEKKSGPLKGAEQIGDIQPQGQQKAPSKPQKPRKGKKDKAPIVEEKLTAAARASTGKSAPTGQQGAPIVEEKPGSGKRKAAKAAPRAEPRKSVGSRESVPTVGEAKGEHQGRTGAGESGDRGAELTRQESGAGKVQVSGEEVGGGIEGAKDDGLFPASLHPKREAFLRGYIESGGRISEACKAASCSRWAHYYWIEKDPEYAALFERMKARALDTLRDEIVRRGVHGIDEPQFYQGVQVGTVKRYSDNLLMFETKRHDPMYRDNPQVALGLAAGGDIKISLSIPRPGEPGEIVDAESREITNSAETTKADI